MRARAGVAFAAAVLSFGGSCRSTEPLDLSGYRAWHSPTAGPTLVPASLAMLCTPVSVAQLEQVREREKGAYGPHAGRFVRVYANTAAVGAEAHARERRFPPGATVVKEKMAAPDQSGPADVAYMIKHDGGRFPASGGWEFGYIPAGPDPDYSGCIECHRAGGSDYVFWRKS